MECAICQTRRPRRFCPGVRGEICSLCCGAEREVTVDCPLDCEFLREARRHEKAPEPNAIPLKSRNARERVSKQAAAPNKWADQQTYKPNQVYSTSGAAASSPVFNQPGGGGVGGGDCCASCGVSPVSVAVACAIAWGANSAMASELASALRRTKVWLIDLIPSV